MDENQIHGGGGSSRKIAKFGIRKFRVNRAIEEFADYIDNKKLYICTAESWPGYRTAYVVRVIKFDDLLSRREMATARKLAVLPGSDLPVNGGCCVLGSKIFFAGGITPLTPLVPDCKIVCAFDIHDPKQEIIRLPQTLNGGKVRPVMVEFAGKIYVLSARPAPNNFEVFDPAMDTWLPLPPYLYPNGGRPFSYCLAGSKLFVSSDYDKVSMNIFSFDLAAQDSQWKSVTTMCKGKPFPFFGKGLVLDVEQLDPNKKLLFALKYAAPPSVNKLVVYIMSLDEDQEDIIQIFQTKLPAEFPSVAGGYHFFHLGGNHICLVNCSADYIDDYDSETYETVGAAMFFEFNIFKKNKHSNYSITVEFQLPCRFGYEGLPRSEPRLRQTPCMLDCFFL